MSDMMIPEATCILNCFISRGLRAGGFIHFTDFGDAIIWEGGFVRDEPIRRGLKMLIEQEYVVEMLAGLELTERGEKQLYGEHKPK